MKTVLCHGCFDVLHTGHIYHLKKAKAFGDYLMVSITHEDSAKKTLRFPAHLRKEMLESLSFVDEVIVSHERTAVEVIKKLKPDFYVKGKEYESLDLDVSGDIYLEKAAVESHGGNMVFTQDEIRFSATKIKENNETFVDISRDYEFQIEDVLAFIKAVSELKVCVIGETIIDRWTPVVTEGLSSKSSCPTALVQGPAEDQLGGAYVVARHLKSFVKQVDLITPDFRSECSLALDAQIQHLFYAQGAVIKNRLFSDNLNTKIFELKDVKLDTVYAYQHDLSPYDLVIVADFGHGMLPRATAQKMRDQVSGYLSIMAQTNSSNFGFNRVDKYPEADMYCIDTQELRLCLNHIDHIDWPLQLKETRSYFRYDKLFVTRGSSGALLYQNEDITSFPALVHAHKIVDPIGAGDAFLSFASLAGYLKYSAEKSLMLASLAGALNTQWLCNAQSIEPKLMIETAKKVL